jgi:hypothetical protein
LQNKFQIQRFKTKQPSFGTVASEVVCVLANMIAYHENLSPWRAMTEHYSPPKHIVEHQLLLMSPMDDLLLMMFAAGICRRFDAPMMSE